MSHPLIRSRLLRAVFLGTSVSTAAAFAVAVPSSPAHAAAPLPAFSADSHSDLVNLRTGLLGADLANVYVGHAQVQVDSQGGLVDPEGGLAVPASARVHAESSNVDAQLLGKNPTIQTDATEAVAPPPADPPQKTLLDVPLAPLADVGVIRGDVSARYAADDACPAAVNGARLLGSARTDTAGVSLLGVPGLPVANVGQIGASFVENKTELVDVPGPGDAVRSTAKLDIAPIHLLGGLVEIRVASPVVITATSDGVSAPTTTVSNTTAEVLVGGKRVLDLKPDGATLPVPVDLGLAKVDLQVGLFQAQPKITGRTASLDLGAVLSVDLNVKLLGGNLVDLHLGAGQMSVSATAPDGGVQCDAPVPGDRDGDGLPDAEEAQLGTDPANPDTDGDGLTDGAEVHTHQTDPLDADTDDGGVTDGAEVTRGTDPLDGKDDFPTTDTDGDGLTDAQEGQLGTDPANPDTDGDGLTDGAEVNTHHTDPKKADTDGGGVNDGDEVTRGTDPLDAKDDQPASGTDSDGDGLTDAEEAQLGTDPHQPDTDGDGLTDGAEVHTHQTDPLDADTDDGGVTDGAEVANGTNPVDDPSDDFPNDDKDGDGLTTDQEIALGTDPANPDTDGDGLTDGAEVTTHHTDPLDPDTDGGGVKDGAEVTRGTDPRDPSDDVPAPADVDTDGDGLTDAEEAQLGTDPHKADTDGDGLTDGLEVDGTPGCTAGRSTSPLKPDTDGDGLKDGVEVKGIDVKQVVYTNRGRPRKGHSIGVVRTNPCAKDTDGDGLTDKQEVDGIAINQKVIRSKKNGGAYKITVRKTDPTKADTDRDGLTDKQEVTGSANKKYKLRKSDPTVKDTDWGGGPDGSETRNGFDPSRHDI
ncbi:hypothetical protein GCM10022237_07980 [Nocardioides ginsengisoli]|uniref:Binary toxin-like calcium binding domain-containing protein n=1 Tax=Nocardioides ginsengisoli TaxID=363868 RepID=A0ABW3W002_9ACTN